MEFILDNNQQVDADFKKILNRIKAYRSGEVADQMNDKGLTYRMNWGVSLMDIKTIAQPYSKNHLLSLKLWNKQWRETMILAAMLDESDKVSEQQMDYWIKSVENSEIIEQLNTYLWVKTPFAFTKSLEWCRGKKHFVRYAGIHLLGRLAITDKNAINEMFDPFFEELLTLSKDENLSTILYRSIIKVALRSEYLYDQTIKFAESLQLSNNHQSNILGQELFEEMNNQYFKDSIIENK